MTRIAFSWAAFPAACILAPSAACAGETGVNILAAGGEGNHVVRYRLDDGEVIDHFVAGGVSSLAFPFALELGPDGSVYVSGWQSDAIHRFDVESGEPQGTLVAPGSGGLDGPTGLVFHPDGFSSSAATPRTAC